jgi:hypothetical protein
MFSLVTFSEINWVSVIVVTILSFPLGAFCHSKRVFGKAWNEAAKPVFDATKKAGFIKLFGFSAILHFIAVIALDVVIGIESTWISGLLKGFFISLVWVFTGLAVTHMFAGRSFRLILIDGGFYIVFFSLAGLILGAW